MNSKCVVSRISLLLLCLSQIDAFELHPIGPRSPKSPLNVNKAKDELLGVVTLASRRHQFHDEGSGVSSSIVGSSSTLDTTPTTDGSNDVEWSRNQFLQNCRTRLTFGLAASAAASWSSFPETGNAKLYSENAANLERINNGDFSGGSVFNNNPDTERGKKRRAMTGCKVAMSREEASTNILQRSKVMSEKECNTMVMDGETEFMLKALRNLDCPTCANGIGRVN